MYIVDQSIRWIAVQFRYFFVTSDDSSLRFSYRFSYRSCFPAPSNDPQSRFFLDELRNQRKNIETTRETIRRYITMYEDCHGRDRINHVSYLSQASTFKTRYIVNYTPKLFFPLIFKLYTRVRQRVEHLKISTTSVIRSNRIELTQGIKKCY